MTDEELIKYQKTVFIYAKKIGHSEETSEDAASFAVQQALTGQVSNPKFILIDFLRQYVRNSRVKGAIHPKFVSMIDVENNVHIYDLTPDQKDKTDSVFKLEYFKKFLTERELGMIELYLKGYDFGEIAKGLGFTPARITQLMDKAFWKMRWGKTSEDQKRRKLTRKKSKCHPDDFNYAHGYCQDCYYEMTKKAINEKRNKKRALEREAEKNAKNVPGWGEYKAMRLSHNPRGRRKN